MALFAMKLNNLYIRHLIQKFYFIHWPFSQCKRLWIAQFNLHFAERAFLSWLRFENGLLTVNACTSIDRVVEKSVRKRENLCVAASGSGQSPRRRKKIIIINNVSSFTRYKFDSHAFFLLLLHRFPLQLRTPTSEQL